MKQPGLFDLDESPGLPPSDAPPDAEARRYAADPAHDVVLEASAGTGKTRVLVDRYVRLIQAGVDPRHILAITFTRKAAAEMRQRVLAELGRRQALGEIGPAAWKKLRERVTDIQISTIDAFCFGLLREFPLEAGVDPGFDIADETEMARFAAEALDVTLATVRRLLPDDERLRLLSARVKGPVLRDALASLLDRRHVAVPAVATFIERSQGSESESEAARRFADRLAAIFESSDHRVGFFASGPSGVLEFDLLVSDIDRLGVIAGEAAAASRLQLLRYRLERYFLTTAGKPRQRLARSAPASAFKNAAARTRHQDAVAALAPAVAEELDRLDADVNVLLARGLQRMLGIAADVFERLLVEHGLLDFASMLDRAIALLERQEEFARSRLKLQSRYHHVLVDEFQDTSRRQWRLVDLLIEAWGEGAGAADAPTSIFVVGDRKQSIYRFRHAEVTLLDEARRRIGALRGRALPRQAITTSFRSVPELLAFVNALAGTTVGDPDLDERFDYGEHDRFPVGSIAPGATRDGRPVVGVVAEDSMAKSARAVAAEIERIIGQTTVRDRSGPPRLARADDIAILFRTRAGHRYYEEALEARGVRTYVYKGLGFFDAPEVQDLQAVLRFLAQPESDLRAAELLRSRLVRLSDVALLRLAPAFAALLTAEVPPATVLELDEIDRAFVVRARESVKRWLGVVDTVPPSELIDLVLRDAAYVHEMGGRRFDQARENVKKVRALVRRVESRGYATLQRIAAYFDTLRTGEESNAIVEAAGAVNLMTIHAAKGLEFPIVFVVNLHIGGRGRSGGFSVIERGVSGEPDVVFGSNDSTRLEDRREAEELRRLLYVAVTRARDRVYLAAEMDHRGQVRRAPRSLATLLPVSLTDAIAGAYRSTDCSAVEWVTPEGSFALSVCRAPANQEEPKAADENPAPSREAGSRAVLRPFGPTVAAATSTARAVPEEVPADGSGGANSRELGTLVHRLLQRRWRPSQAGPQSVDHVLRLMRREELTDVADPRRLAEAAIEVVSALQAREDIQNLIEQGTCFFEVPFTYEPPDQPGRRIRGSIDCVVVGPDGLPTVLEFKTGRPHTGHAHQVEIYRKAIAEFLQRPDVEARILYPN